MRSIPLVSLLLALLIAPLSLAQQPANGPLRLRKYHGWGRFPAGSWRKVRVRKESFGAKGELLSVSITEAKTTLTRVSDENFQLHTASSIELAGQKYVPAPQTSTRDFFGVPAKSSFKRVRETDFVLNGLKTKCGVYQVVVASENSKRVTSFHVPADGAPLVLRQNTVATSNDGQRLFEINVDVLAQDMPLKVMADTMPCAYLRTVQVSGDKKTVTMEAYSESVPGGVVSQSVKVLDRNGRLLERQTAELVDYGRAVAAPVKPATLNLRDRILRRRAARK